MFDSQKKATGSGKACKKLWTQYPSASHIARAFTATTRELSGIPYPISGLVAALFLKVGFVRRNSWFKRRKMFRNTS